MGKRHTFPEPYYVADPDVIDNDGYTGFAVGSDLNREIVEPGTSEAFPDGAIGVRVDDDFWAVAALPYDQYKDVPIEKIAAEFWPELTHATFKPDSGDPWWEEMWAKVRADREQRRKAKP